VPGELCDAVRQASSELPEAGARGLATPPASTACEAVTSNVRGCCGQRGRGASEEARRDDRRPLAPSRLDRRGGGQPLESSTSSGVPGWNKPSGRRNATNSPPQSGLGPAWPTHLRAGSGAPRATAQRQRVRHSRVGNSEIGAYPLGRRGAPAGRTCTLRLPTIVASISALVLMPTTSSAWYIESKYAVFAASDGKDRHHGEAKQPHFRHLLADVPTSEPSSVAVAPAAPTSLS
jgi:hypothetical protein